MNKHSRFIFRNRAQRMLAATAALLTATLLSTGAALAATLSISNPSLLFEPGSAVVSLSSSASSVDWTVKNTANATVASGTATISGGQGSFNANSLGAGYYSLTLSASGATTISTNLGIIAGLNTQPTTSIFGTTPHPDWQPTLPYPDLLAKVGFGAVRFDMRWEQIEPSPGVYNFAPNANYDTLINGLIARGIKPLVILGYANPNYDNNARPSTPAGYTAYANYAKAIAQRYGSSVDYEVYNEYNHPGGFIWERAAMP